MKNTRTQKSLFDTGKEYIDMKDKNGNQFYIGAIFKKKAYFSDVFSICKIEKIWGDFVYFSFLDREVKEKSFLYFHKTSNQTKEIIEMKK